MANNILPYAFTPGTKAKAEEVNANFNALAEVIDSNNTSLNTELSEFKTEITDELEATAGEKVDKNLSDCQCITNCIVEAPNGILSYVENDLTVPSGLTVIIPNGKNIDGTFSNLKFSLENDVTLTIDTAYTNRYVFIKSDSTIVTAQKFVEFKTQPTGNHIAWLNTEENKMYLSNANGEFAEVQMAIIARYLNTTATAITGVEALPVLALLKKSDKERLMMWNLADYSAPVSIVNTSVQRNCSWTAPFDAEVQIVTSQANNIWGSVMINSVWVGAAVSETNQRTVGTFCFRVRKGDVVTGDYWWRVVAYPLKGVNYD